MAKKPRQPLSPEAAQVVRALGGGRLSRRSLLGGAGALGVGAALAGCGTSGTGGGSAASAASAAVTSLTPAKDLSETDKKLYWANWTLYLDYDDTKKVYPSLEQFIKESGVKVTYAEDVDDNETYFGKIQAQLRAGQDFGADIITLTDWMAARLVKNGWVQKLDHAKIKNGANILDSLKGSNVAWDPNRDYSYTWQSGFAGFGYSKTLLAKATGGKLTEIKTIEDLWNPALKGRVEVLAEMRDTMGIILMSQGVKLADGITDAQWNKALDVLNAQISSGQIRQVKGNSYKEDLISGDAIAVIGWSGDIYQLAAEDTKGNDFTFTLPESGGTLWSDNLMVPMGSPHLANAEKLINYYYDPKIAAEVAAYVNYICPVKGAQAELAKTDPELAKSELIFPSAAYLAKVQAFPSLDDAKTKEFTTSFQKVLGV